MKKIYDHDDLMKHHEDNCGKCKVVIHQGHYLVTCDKCFEPKKDPKVVKKEVRKDIIDKIDANGNGRITKKEIKDFLGKDDK